MPDSKPSSMSPGQILLDLLVEREISTLTLAHKIPCSLSVIYSIILESHEITPTMASKLEKALGISAEFWLVREQQYRSYVRSLEARLDELG